WSSVRLRMLRLRSPLAGSPLGLARSRAERTILWVVRRNRHHQRAQGATSMSEPFLERLRQGPLLCDGAMGTVLYARAPESVLHGRCFDELVLTDAGLVQEIHREYIQAGAQIIETNTFGANAVKLGAYGLSDQVQMINRRAAELAREARDIAGQSVFVAGAVGPTGQVNIPLAHDGDARLVRLRGVFREQIEA